MSVEHAANPYVSPVAGQRPTRVRYGVLGLACALSMITYLDRVCMGSAAGSIKDALGLDDVTELHLAFTMFAFAYSAFEVPSGWLGDIFGPRTTLIRIVLWWSVFTALTGVVGMNLGGDPGILLGGLPTLIVIRFLFGMGEAGAYPNITRALHNWFPLQERGFTQGLVWMSGRLMGGLTPLVLMFLIEGANWRGKMVSAPLMNWRAAFWCFGLLGIGWCVAFALWFRNHPHEKPGVNEAELALIGTKGRAEAELGGVPWRKILTSRNLWALCLMYACAAYGWYFNITYLPNFLEQHHGVQKSDLLGAIYKGGPLLFGSFGCLVGGLATDAYIRRTGNRRMGRRLFGIVGHVLCAIGYFACIYARSVEAFILTISLATFCNDLTMGPAWATCQDIGRRYAAIVAGCMNTVGNMGGALCGYATAVIVNHSVSNRAAELGVDVANLSSDEKLAASLAGYHINFVVFACVYLMAVVCWLSIDSTKPVAADESQD